MTELLANRPPLRLALSPDDGGANPTGLATDRMLAASGVPAEAFLEWGGELIYGERPLDCIRAVDEGRARFPGVSGVIAPEQTIAQRGRIDPAGRRGSASTREIDRSLISHSASASRPLSLARTSPLSRPRYRHVILSFLLG
jgi:hypothetical protein